MRPRKYQIEGKKVVKILSKLDELNTSNLERKWGQLCELH